jgi:hypothetical protein
MGQLHACCCIGCVLQVVSLATELEDALLQLCTREQLLEQVWAQLRGVSTATDLPSSQDTSPSAAVATALSRTEQLQKLRQQQKQRWMLQPPAAGSQSVGGLAAAAALRPAQQQQQGKQASVAGLERRLSAAAENAHAAGFAQQAVQSAMRRSSQSSEGVKGAGLQGGAAGVSTAYRLQQHQQTPQQGLTMMQQQQQHMQQEEVQTVVVDAVRQLREQVTGAHQLPASF